MSKSIRKVVISMISMIDDHIHLYPYYSTVLFKILMFII